MSKLSKEYLHNISKLLSGSVISQSLTFLFTPILAWYFTPSEFGQYSFYFAVVVILSNLATVKLEQAIIIPRSDKQAKSLVVACLAINFVFCLLLLTILLAIHFISQFYTVYLMWPLSVFLVAASQTLYAWYNRCKKYNLLALQKLVQAALTNGVPLLLYSLGLVHSSMILGLIIAQFAVFCLLIQQCRINFTDFLKVKLIVVCLKKYRHFVFYQTPATLIEKSAVYIPTLLIAALYSDVVLGMYALALRVLAAPVALLSSVVSDVFRQHAAKDLNTEGSCLAIFCFTMQRLAILAVLPFVLLVTAAPYLFSVIFGSDWLLAGQIAQIMSVVFLLQFIVSPLSGVIIIRQKQKQDFLIQMYLLFSTVSVFVITKLIFDNVLITFFSYSVCYSIKYIVEFIYAYNLTSVVEEAS